MRQPLFCGVGERQGRRFVSQERTVMNDGLLREAVAGGLCCQWPFTGLDHARNVVLFGLTSPESISFTSGKEERFSEVC